VIAIDADPDSNLAASLGHPDPDTIVPLSAHKDLINERVGTGGVIRLNPRVDDLVDTIATDVDGIKLMVLGNIPRGGSGCFCSPSALLKALMLHLLAQPDEWVILDMEAGLEHLGRGSSGGVDGLLIIVEPGQRSIETARRIARLAADIGIQKAWCVANKVRGDEDVRYLRDALAPLPLIGRIPLSDSLSGFTARIDGRSAVAGVDESIEGILQTIQSPRSIP
jgi:CO dehydrogenase maturation factor